MIRALRLSVSNDPSSAGAISLITELGSTGPKKCLSIDRTLFMSRSSSQRVISRWCYPDEYEASLIECMRDAEGGDEMMTSHSVHLAKLRDNPPLRKLVDALRTHRREVEGKQKVIR